MPQFPIKTGPLYLHAVIVKKTVPLVQAKKIVEHVTRTDRDFYMRETKQSYRFRIRPKTKFSMFVSKPINEYTTLVFGQLI